MSQLGVLDLVVSVFLFPDFPFVPGEQPRDVSRMHNVNEDRPHHRKQRRIRKADRVFSETSKVFLLYSVP